MLKIRIPLVPFLFLCTGLLLCKPTPAIRAATGVLEIHSQPAGAQVYIDRQRVGITPYIDAEISTGVHDVRLHYDDLHPDKHWVVTIDDITPVKKTFIFTQPLGGWLVQERDIGTEVEYRGNVQVVSVPAPATVWIDGQHIGTTPLGYRDILEGMYKITIKSGNWTGTARFPVRRGKTTKIIAYTEKDRIKISVPGQLARPYNHLDASFYIKKNNRWELASLVVDIDRKTRLAMGTCWCPPLLGNEAPQLLKGELDNKKRQLVLHFVDTAKDKNPGAITIIGQFAYLLSRDAPLLATMTAYQKNIRLQGSILYQGRWYRIDSFGDRKSLLPQVIVRTAQTQYSWEDFQPEETSASTAAMSP